MSVLKNAINFEYVFDEQTETQTSEFEVEKTLTEPSVEIKKSGYPSTVKKGDVVTYRVDINIGDGDAFDCTQVLSDTHDSLLELVSGTLKLDGVVLEVQDLSSIEVDFEPNSYHYLEYQMLCK